MGRTYDVRLIQATWTRLIDTRLIAQLHPADRAEAQPQGANRRFGIEGDGVDLGPKGMYASLGFEDLETLFGWVDLKGGGGNSSEARRPGLGF
jgi:hypothetical protein